MIYGIGLSGKKFAGKDAVYDHITKVVRDRRVIRHKWATAVREDAVKMLEAIGIYTSVAELEDRRFKEPFVGLLQWYGTDFRRRQDPDYWVRRGLQAAERELRFADRRHEASPLFVNTDTRFPNEVTLPQEQGWVVIRLEVSREKQLERADALGLTVTEREFDHASETALDDFTGFDYVIDSNDDLDVVEMQVEGILEKLEIRLRNIR